MEGIRRIVVPVDFNRHTDTLAEFAIYMANKLNARVTFIHVMKNLPDFLDYEPSTMEQLDRNFRAHAEGKMTALMESVKNKCLECDGEVLTGDASEAIIAYAGKVQADLIVIATHGNQGIEKVLLGSVADRVIKGAPCPALVFNPFRNDRGYAVCKPLSSCVTAM